MDYIFVTLLNRRPTHQDLILNKNKNLHEVKMYIKNSVEFKIFYNSNLKKIEKFFVKF